MEKKQITSMHTGRLVIDCYRTFEGPGDYFFERGVIKTIHALYQATVNRKGSNLLQELEEGGVEGQSGAIFKWHFEPDPELDSKE